VIGYNGTTHAEALAVESAARAAHPNAERPDPSGEPPWHKMGDDCEDEPDVLGSTTCPRCSKLLHYLISSYNGHIGGCCTTPGCVRFRQ
jgi:hypothetical protein